MAKTNAMHQTGDNCARQQKKTFKWNQTNENLKKKRKKKRKENLVFDGCPSDEWLVAIIIIGDSAIDHVD